MDKIDEIMYGFLKELDYEFAIDMFKNISSGKKLRSKLLLKIAGQNDESLRLCAVVELIHLASLLHDDVIDESDTRRGKASINSLFGVKNSIMLGDILYSKGFYELTKFDSKIAKLISDAVVKLSIGELMDVKLGDCFNHDRQKYMQMIYYKTAVLIEATSQSASILAGLDSEKLKIYGRNLGLAFQIIDDVLDITQDSKTLGKPALNDYKEGKTTLPYIYLYENLNDNDKNKLKSMFLKELDEDEKNWIKSMFEKFGCVQRSIDEAKELGNSALLSIKEYKNDGLEEIIKSMIDRKF